MVLLILVLLAMWVSAALVVVVVCLTVIFILSDTGERAHANILRKEVLRSEVVHKVLGSNVAAIFLILFVLEGLKLLADSLRNVLEEVRESFLAIMCGDVLAELLVDFVNYLRAPALDLIVDKVDLLAQLIGLALVLGEADDLLVERLDFRREGRAVLLVDVLVIVVLHLELVQSTRQGLVLVAEVVRLALVLGDGNKQLRVCLLTS